MTQPWDLATTPISSRGRVLPPRAHAGVAGPCLSLNGTWQFALHPCANPEGDAGGVPQAAREDADLSGFTPVTVPSHWVLDPQGRFGRPAYTNVQLPIPIDPPFVPQDNPTGDYRKEFVLPETWPTGGRSVIRLLGAESSADVFLNGAHLGTALGSRLSHEFDASDALRSGRNTLAIRVRQFSPGTYLEDQDQWWLPGLFRDVELLHVADGAPWDIITDTDLDGTTGRLAISAVDRDGAPVSGEVTVEIPELDVVEHIALGQTLSLPGVAPWSAQRPTLYEVRVSARDGAWSLTRRLGFRRIEILGGVLHANGEPLVVHGVNRHEIHRRAGRVFDEEDARRDLELMKAFNINAIRTSHYPPHPRLLDLADEIGLWVMLEADIETHAFELVGWAGNPSDDPAWADAILDRVQRTVTRDRHHACVFSYSLGNESHTGRNLARAAAWVRAADPSRPIHYEGDRALAYSDIYSRMYPALEEVEAVLGGAGLPIAAAHHPAAAITAAQADHVRTRPFLMCEYAHAMGTGPGGLDEYVAAMHHPRHCGGFIWEWRDHALAVAADGGEVLRYGGDFGEKVHDGNFVCDGLIDAHSRPGAGLIAWANLIAPVIATFDDDDGGVALDARWLTEPRSDYLLAWQVRVAGEVSSGIAALPALSPRRWATISVPELTAAVGGAAGREAIITLAVIDPQTRGIAPYPIGEVSEAEPIGTPGSRHSRGRIVSVRAAVVNASPPPALAAPPAAAAPPTSAGARSAAERLAELGFATGEVTCWRAPTDNDGGHGALDYWHEDPAAVLSAPGGRADSSAERWLAARLNVPFTSERSRTSRAGIERRRLHTGFASQSFGLDIEVTRVATPTGLQLRYEMRPTGSTWPRYIPRQGVRFTLPGASWHVTYAGDGPTENYADLTAGVRPGVFSGLARDFYAHPLVPQEASLRQNVRWVEFAREDLRIRLDLVWHPLDGATPASYPAVSICPWPAEVLAGTCHDDELPEPDSLDLVIDAAHHGIGSRSCGPDVRPEYSAHPVAGTLVIEARLS